MEKLIEDIKEKRYNIKEGAINDGSGARAIYSTPVSASTMGNLLDDDITLDDLNVPLLCIFLTDI